MNRVFDWIENIIEFISFIFMLNGRFIVSTTKSTINNGKWEFSYLIRDVLINILTSMYFLHKKTNEANKWMNIVTVHHIFVVLFVCLMVWHCSSLSAFILYDYFFYSSFFSLTLLVSTWQHFLMFGKILLPLRAVRMKRKLRFYELHFK